MQWHGGNESRCLFYCAFPVAATFSHHTSKKDGSKGHPASDLDDEAIMKVVDHFMESMDMNNDGYVDYIEYNSVLMSHEAAAASDSAV